MTIMFKNGFFTILTQIIIFTIYTFKTSPDDLEITLITNGIMLLPFVGCRFICTTCEEYNICETCEVDSTHPHFFLKIRYALPDHTKLNIKFVFEELESEKSERNSLLSSGTSLRKPKITDNEKKKNKSLRT